MSPLHDDPRQRRQRGSAAVPALIVLLAIAGLLGWNYYRNYQTDSANDRATRPYAGYPTEHLALMTEGYRLELTKANAAQLGGRVATRDQHFFGEKIREFERVQKQSRKVRDRAIEVAELQTNLDALEAEQRIRADPGAKLMRHLKLMFRI